MNTLEVNQQKIFHTKALLTDVISNPTPFKDDLSLKLALRSQGGLAKYSNSERGIAPCSLNTLKNASEPLLERGFIDLDELRIAAKSFLDDTLASNKQSKNSKEGLKHKINDLENKLCNMRKFNFLLTVIISELRGDIKKMALSNESPELKENEFRRINQRIEAELNYTTNELNGNNLP